MDKSSTSKSPDINNSNTNNNSNNSSQNNSPNKMNLPLILVTVKHNHSLNRPQTDFSHNNVHSSKNNNVVETTHHYHQKLWDLN
ncbi:unnamed protein product [Cunninghamella blakesleeana]